MNLFSTRYTKLSLYWQLSTVFLLSLVLFPSISHAQNNSERNNTSYGSEYTNTYYIDEAGLQLAVNATPLDNFLDPNTYELGPYDVISLQGIGLTEFSYRAVLVNALGDIVTPIAGIEILPGYGSYRNSRMTGDLVFDTRLAYSINQKSKFSLLVNNLLNREYTNRPGNVLPPRTIVWQYSLKF